MRFSRHSFLGISIGAVLFALFIVLSVGCSGSDEDTAPRATAGTAGDTAGGPAGGGPVSQGEPGPFTGPIQDGFTSTPLAVDETPDTPYGVVLADAATGDGEYWRVPSAAGQQGEYYGVDTGHRWLQWLDSAGGRLLVADRETGETYTLDTNAWVVVAGPTHSGVMVLQQSGAETFAVVDLAADPLTSRLRFELPPDDGEQNPQVHLLDDGAALLFAGKRIDLTTGKVTEHVVPDGGFTGSFVATDGGWLDVTFDGDAEVSITAKRFDANGQEIPLDAQPALELEPNAGSFAASPDGRWVALSLGLGLSSPPQTSVWPTVAMADLQTGELAFRALRVSQRSGLRSLGWLPDSSGLLVATPESFAVLKTDGSLQALPFGPVEEEGVGGVPAPVVSPVDAGKFLFQDQIADADGNGSGPTFAAAEWASTEPWNNYGFNLDGSELRFMQSPSLGRDYPLTVLTAFGLPAKIERPPFPGQLDLRVAEQTAVHPSPDEATATLVELAEGDTVTVLEDQQRNSSAWPQISGDGADFSVYGSPWWVYVRTPTGMQGWVPTESLDWP